MAKFLISMTYYALTSDRKISMISNKKVIINGTFDIYENYKSPDVMTSIMTSQQTNEVSCALLRLDEGKR